MFADRYPSFQKGRILKTEMLSNLRDYPRQMFDIQYSSYSDGIICGSEVLVGEETLTIKRGIVKHDGRLFSLEQDVELPYSATGNETLIKIRFPSEPSVRSDITSYETEIVLEPAGQLRGNELELGRYKLKPGARLRQSYEGFHDLITEYNTVQLIHVEHAAYGRSTMDPIVMRLYGEELLMRGCSDAHDISFAMLCLNEGTVAMPVIEHYVAARLGLERRGVQRGFHMGAKGGSGAGAHSAAGRERMGDTGKFDDPPPVDRDQLYGNLRRILGSVHRGGAAKGDLRPGGMRRMLVD
ncbi:DNA and RNA helicase [Paenibacillus algorifonticola]|uniref:DNA and RNA helicase n=1 Tax=Paenibacillus algorifonticola TaxID=684063 RepID=UPI003D2CF860